MTREDVFLLAAAAVVVVGSLGWYLFGTVDQTRDDDRRGPVRRSDRARWVLLVPLAVVLVLLVAFLR